MSHFLLFLYFIHFVWGTPANIFFKIYSSFSIHYSYILVIYSFFLGTLSKKWGTTPIKALEQEKQSRPNEEGVQDIMDFFVQVFVKAYYLKTQFHFELADCLDYLSDKVHIDNTEFLLLVKNSPPPSVGLKAASIDLRGVLPPEALRKLRNPIIPPPNYVLPLPAGVLQQMATVDLRPQSETLNSRPEDRPTTKPEPIDLPAHPQVRVKGEQVEFPNVPSVQVVTVDPNYRTRLIKDDPDSPPASMQPASMHSGASVRVMETVPQQPLSRVGQGSKCLQFFYESPGEGEKIAFKPVYVDNEEEVQCVVALVAERAAEYQSKVGLRPRPVQYYSDAVRAKSRLDPDIVRYIERCFTKSGMRAHRTGFKKRTYPKRKDTLIVKSVKSELRPGAEENERTAKVVRLKAAAVTQPVARPFRIEVAAEAEPAAKPTITEVAEVAEPVTEQEADPIRIETAPSPTHELSDVEIDEPTATTRDPDFEVADEVAGYVSDDEASKRSLEQLVFGSIMPKVRLKKKDLARPPSERAGRGGHNVRDEGNPHTVLKAVGFMLNPEEAGADRAFARQMKLSSRFTTQQKYR